jgi:hypothetical protein
MAERKIVLAAVFAVAIVGVILMLSSSGTGLFSYDQPNTPGDMETWRVQASGRALWGAQKPYGEPLGVINPDGGEYKVDGQMPGNLGQTETRKWGWKKTAGDQIVSKLACIVSERGDYGLEYPKIEADRLEKSLLKDCYDNYRNAGGDRTIYTPAAFISKDKPEWDSGRCCFDRTKSRY